MDQISRYIAAVFFYWTRAQAAKVSLERITDFLNNVSHPHKNLTAIPIDYGYLQTELLDGLDLVPSAQALYVSAIQSKDEIGFENAMFSWSKDNTGTATPSTRTFMLKIENKLLFKKGCVNLVTGPTGSGKSSLLVALLGELIAQIC